ncbi:13158_t:CDS:2 [Funneliformis geosporum]|uniref:Trehalase n=1 Tax=Funneliformis geosporum TaxID=1117311 RepID=A0A9W4SWP2_9GLOM|nr:13967_t:CDS:2 [Funneliformis geosporum]CAI2184257.1 13158_t:CDS:2 [Funneliformis geosporum]
MSVQEKIKFLKSLQAIRERSRKVYKKAEKNELKHFNLDLSKLQDAVITVISLIKRDYNDISEIPPHGRWRHFDVGGRSRVHVLMDQWKQNNITTQEITRRILDLFVVSVLLDAGAGNSWSYKEPDTGSSFNRSEGLAIASYDMFKAGLFSSQSSQPHQVDADRLININVDDVRKAFQVDDNNPLEGLEGRSKLLSRLGQALKNHPEFFEGKDGLPPRPGNLLDYLLSHSTTTTSQLAVTVKIDTLWSVVVDGLAEIWPPTRTSVNGVSLGDVWPCEVLKSAGSTADSTEHLVPFHKLSQWLTYSLIEPMIKISNITFEGVEHLTGLPEYRNADTERGLNFHNDNVFQKAVEVVPMFEVDDPVVIEWRAMTVVILDVIAEKVRKELELTKEQLNLAQIYCQGKLLHKIQLANLFEESKVFVDKPTIKPVDEVLKAFSALPENATKEQLFQFVNSNFGLEGQELIYSPISPFPSNPSFLDDISSPILLNFAKMIHMIWNDLSREFDENSLPCKECESTFIRVEKKFIIPGGRFRELYYQDSYYIIEGLLVSELFEVAKNFIENFLDLVERYGFVPNGSRIYYLNRSQTPLLIQMVKIYYKATNDTSFLERAFPTLLKEYDYWRVKSTVTLTHSQSNKRYNLNHYTVKNSLPRPEEYLEDYIVVEQNSNNFNETQKKQLYADISTAAESGWDFSSRWARNPYIPSPSPLENNREMLRTLNTRNIIPVDLNSILYMNEITLSEFADVLGNKYIKQVMKSKANQRREAIMLFMWDEKMNLFMDFNLTSGTRSEIFTLASYFPFWAESFTESLSTNELLGSFSHIKSLLEKYPGSPPTTLIRTGLQWDFPNAWPPLEYAIIKGLINLHTKQNQPISDSEFMKLAFDVSQRFVSSAYCTWKLSGVIFEKFNALDTNLPGGAGEYTVQTGFGWTNGVLLWIFSLFGDKLQNPTCTH